LLGDLKAWVDCERQSLSDTAVISAAYYQRHGGPVQLALMAPRGVPYQLHVIRPLFENRQKFVLF